MKEFPQKLSALGWDIGAIKAYAVTGFSGTNDTLRLLSLAVKHLDLSSQSHTNALVFQYLLQDGAVQSLVIISPYEANELVTSIREAARVTLHIFAPRANASFAPIDRLELSTTLDVASIQSEYRAV